MKRIILIAAVFLGAFLFLFPHIAFQQPAVHPVVKTTISSSVTVILDTGTKISTISGVTAQNAFQALQEVAKKQNLTLMTKQYDFGVFVQAVGTFTNTTDKSWIYFVNGKAGTVAADKQSIVNHDTVEWQYTKPTAE